MKKLMLVVILLTALLVCKAPVINSEQQKRYHEGAINEIKRQAKKAEFIRMRDHLRAKESPDWTKINQIGCMGWFQFAPSTLIYLGYGYITPARFKSNPDIFPPELQIELLERLIKLNEVELEQYMKYVGLTINGVLITKSGILAGAHLGGATGVKRYLDSNGNANSQDMFGTSIQDYIEEFQGYNI